YGSRTAANQIFAVYQPGHSDRVRATITGAFEHQIVGLTRVRHVDGLVVALCAVRRPRDLAGKGGHRWLESDAAPEGIGHEWQCRSVHIDPHGQVCEWRCDRRGGLLTGVHGRLEP